MRQKILRGSLRRLVLLKEDQKRSDWCIGGEKNFHEEKIWSTKNLLTLAETETSGWKWKADVFIFWKRRNSCTAQKALKLWNKYSRKVLDFQSFNDPRANLDAFLPVLLNTGFSRVTSLSTSHRQGRVSHRHRIAPDDLVDLCSLWTCKIKGL